MKGKERPPVPNILGLNRGKIEAQRELWASRRRAGFSEKTADLLIISKEDEGFLNLPVLGITELSRVPGQPLWKPRFEPLSGAVYTTRWQNVSEVDPSEFTVFAGRKNDRLLPSQPFPTTWDVARLIPQKLPTIEAAMRQQDEIAHDMGVASGVEQARVEELLMALNGISQVFLRPEDISSEQLEGLSRQAERLLREHGLLAAKDTVWMKILEYTLRATSRDSLGRINPMISRILARAAYLGVTHRELIQRAAKEKANKVFFYLAVVRDDTRFRIQNAELALDSLGGFGEVRWITSQEALVVEQSLRSLVDEILKPIQAAPYVQASRTAEAILVGKIAKSNKVAKAFGESLDESGRRQFGRKSAVEYLRGKDATSAKKRIKQAFEVLHESIFDLDNEETRVFD